MHTTHYLYIMNLPMCFRYKASMISNSPSSTSFACVLTMQLCAYLSKACTQSNVKETDVGYRCEDSAEAFHNMSMIPPRECTLLCLQWTSCVQVNHNRVEHYCLLFSSFCTLVQLDEEFTTLRYVDDVVTRDECIRWVRFPGTLPTGGIVINAPYGMTPQLLARGSIEAAVIPGKLYTNILSLWSVYDGQIRQITNNTEYLDIHPSCFAVWVLYNSGLGMDLPDGAVKGGWLSDGTPLYVARVMGIRGTSLGYYNPSMDKGIIGDGGQIIRDVMEILVLMWRNYLLNE